MSFSAPSSASNSQKALDFLSRCSSMNEFDTLLKKAIENVDNIIYKLEKERDLLKRPIAWMEDMMMPENRTVIVPALRENQRLIQTFTERKNYLSGGL